MGEYSKTNHTIYDIKYHVIWVTKYRYKVLNRKIAERLRKLIRKGCEALGIIIIQGNIAKDHINLLISCSSSIEPSKLVRYLKEDYQD